MSISQKSSYLTHEAIVFFADGEIIKEMLYTEFEALLDCVVPMRDFVGRNMEAAYVRLDSALAVVAVVLFYVPFDARGFPELSWNVPLRQLAETGVYGPDLGGGPVRLATHSQCPVPGQEANLWDMQFGANGNTLNQLREKLHSNRLGIDAVDYAPLAPVATVQSMPASVAMPPPARGTAAPGADTSDAVMAFMQQSNQQVAMLREQHQRELMMVQERLAVLQQQVQVLHNEKAVLSEQLDEREAVFADECATLERKLQRLTDQARAQLATTRRELESARDAALASGEQRVREALATSEQSAREAMASHLAALAASEQSAAEERTRFASELQAREEQLHALRIELTELRRDKLRLMNDGADRFFALLKEKGVKFVAYQPGAGHLTIAMEDLNRFLEDTETFVAEKCGISLEQYLRWLAHYTNPVCQGSAGHGGLCAKPLPKLLKPAEFVSGMNDRCDIHKQVPRSAMSQGKPA